MIHINIGITSIHPAGVSFSLSAGEGGIRLKLHYIDKLETELSQAEIKEKLQDIALEDRFFNICIKDEKLYRMEFKENSVSFLPLSGKGVQDMLSPRIHIKISEKEQGCICELYRSNTYGIIFMFVWWSAFWGSYAFVSLVKASIIASIFGIMICAFGVWVGRRHCINICKKAVDIFIGRTQC